MATQQRECRHEVVADAAPDEQHHHAGDDREREELILCHAKHNDTHGPTLTCGVVRYCWCRPLTNMGGGHSRRERIYRFWCPAARDLLRGDHGAGALLPRRNVANDQLARSTGSHHQLGDRRTRRDVVHLTRHRAGTSLGAAVRHAVDPRSVVHRSQALSLLPRVSRARATSRAGILRALVCAGPGGTRTSLASLGEDLRLPASRSL